MIFCCPFRDEDLPEELRIRIINEGIDAASAEKHFEVLLHILHFKTKQTFYTTQVPYLTIPIVPQPPHQAASLRLRFIMVYEEKKANRSMPPKRRNENPSLIHPEIVSVLPIDQEELALLENIPKKNYKLQEQVGKGGYGKIFAARSIVDRKTNHRIVCTELELYPFRESNPCPISYPKPNLLWMPNSVAVKRLPHIGARNIRKNFQEIRFLRYCMNHPNILNFIRASLYAEEIWLVTEFIDGLSVMELVMAHEFTESEIVNIVKGTLRGLSFLHENQIAHRDLKSGNIMVSRSGDVKILDFGLSSDVSQGEVTHMPFWMPPEMILHKPHGLPADIWSLGITAVELANGYPPHRKSPIKAMFTAATVGYPTPFKLGNRWSPLFLDFITRCLRKDPLKRWTAFQLIKHEFLGKGKRAPIEHMANLISYVLDQSQY